MCEKYIYTIPKEALDRVERGHGILLDRRLYSVLMQHKNIINRIGTSKNWDTYKKQTNMFELIFTTSNIFPSIANVSPYSRSYFKHWEILSDFRKELALDEKQTLKCAFLAEGPGGFIEAFVRHRKERDKAKTDTLFGVTLISNDRQVPSWKFSREFITSNNIKLLFGTDGDGSLYSIDNIDSFIREIGQNECEYVTADGGFDFSNNFNDQELASLLLITAEIYTALSLQKLGGSFVLKIYDISLDLTKRLLFILANVYDSLSFIKPHTSRPANSEKYILCRGYQGAPADSNIMALLREAIETKSYAKITDMIDPSIEFLESVALYNVVFVMKQIIYINRTMNHIWRQADPWETARQQVESAIRWCHKYNISINHHNLEFYKRLSNVSNK